MNRRPIKNQQNGIKQSIRRINREINPCVRVAPAKSQPNPCAVVRAKWFERKVLVQKISSSNNSGALLTVADISTAMSGITSGTLFKVRSVSVWNTTLGSAIKADCDVNVLTLGSDTESIVGQDYGNGTNLAGIKFDIPNVIAQGIAVSQTDLTVVLTLIDPRSIATNQGFIAEFSLSILL